MYINIGKGFFTYIIIEKRKSFEIFLLLIEFKFAVTEPDCCVVEEN